MIFLKGIPRPCKQSKGKAKQQSSSCVIITFGNKRIGLPKETARKAANASKSCHVLPLPSSHRNTGTELSTLYVDVEFVDAVLSTNEAVSKLERGTELDTT